MTVFTSTSRVLTVSSAVTLPSAAYPPVEVLVLGLSSFSPLPIPHLLLGHDDSAASRGT